MEKFRKTEQNRLKMMKTINEHKMRWSKHSIKQCELLHVLIEMKEGKRPRFKTE